MQTNTESNHDELELLLPWYVNGTLLADEHRRVELHLENCERCREAVHDLREIAAVVGDESAAPLVPEASAQDFLDKLDTVTSVENETWRSGALFAVAASLLLAVAAGLLFIVGPQSDDRPTFETATDGSGSASISYIFAIGYTESNSGPNYDTLINAVPDAQLTKLGDEERIVVTMPSMTVSELGEFAEDLQALDGIDRVTLVGIQLPVE